MSKAKVDFKEMNNEPKKASKQPPKQNPSILSAKIDYSEDAIPPNWQLAEDHAVNLF